MAHHNLAVGPPSIVPPFVPPPKTLVTWQISWKPRKRTDHSHVDEADRLTLCSDTGISPYMYTFDEAGFYEDFKAPEHMDRTTFEAYFDNIWEHPGMLWSWNESSFAKDFPHDNATRYYDRRSSAELRQFVRQRGLRDPCPAGLTLKPCYIRVLVAADRASHFRFLDLPPEMRQMLYREVLTLRRSYRLAPAICEPTILQTCQQINDEATRVLYNNVIRCEFAAHNKTTDAMASSCKVHNERLCHTSWQERHISRFLRLPSGIDDYPAFFRRITRLKIKIKVGKPVSFIHMDKAAITVNNLLLTLSSFLMEGHCLKNLHIDCQFEPGVIAREKKRILFPLRRIKNVKHIRITTNENNPLENAVQDKLCAELRDAEPAYNTLRMFKILEDEAGALTDLRHLRNDYDYDFEDGVFDDLNLATYYFDEYRKYCCISSVREERFHCHLQRVQRAVDETWDFLQAQMAAVVKKRQARKAFNRVMDGGKLKEATEIWGYVSEEGSDVSEEELRARDWDVSSFSETPADQDAPRQGDNESTI